jgi:hypothetical protein
MRRISVSTVCCLGKIRAECLQNTSLEYCRYANPLCNRFLVVLLSYSVSPGRIAGTRSVLISFTDVSFGTVSISSKVSLPTKSVYRYLVSFMRSTSPSVWFSLNWIPHLMRIWWRMQMIKFLVMQLSLFFCHFLTLRTKHSPQRHVLERNYDCSFLHVITRNMYCWIFQLIQL